MKHVLPLFALPADVPPPPRKPESKKVTEATVFFGRYGLARIFYENATASAFPAATRLELVDKSYCGVSERTTIKWNKFLTFRRFPAVTRPELVDRSCCRELQSASGGRPLKRFSLVWICDIRLKFPAGENFYNP